MQAAKANLASQFPLALITPLVDGLSRTSDQQSIDVNGVKPE